MELRLHPHGDADVESAVRRAAHLAGVAENGHPDGYGSPWLRAARAEAVDRAVADVPATPRARRAARSAPPARSRGR